MSMSTIVKAFKPADEKWRQMKTIWDACRAAGVDMPPAVDTYFNGEEPDEGGVEVSKKALLASGALREWKGSDAEGYEVDITKLSPDVKIIRFFNSW